MAYATALELQREVYNSINIGNCIYFGSKMWENLMDRQGITIGRFDQCNQKLALLLRSNVSTIFLKGVFPNFIRLFQDRTPEVMTKIC